LRNQTSGSKTIVWRCASDDVVAGTFSFKVEAVSILDLVLVQGGIFIMGCTLEQGGDCNNDERPAHKMTVQDFYLGRTEVTQALWTSIMGSNPSFWKGDSLPVERVSWVEVQAFLHKLNAKTGMRFRLPTEAEWEYAARGGLKSRGTKYSGSSNVDEVGWHVANSGNQTHPVAQKKPNELGLYDMSGNVYEWCSDWYGNASVSSGTPWPTSGLYRVYRGGSWGDYDTSLRTTHRNSYKPDLKRSYTGFRIAHSIK
jgi:formylglycine-generating enzyme required for sulfatase activity